MLVTGSPLFQHVRLHLNGGAHLDLRSENMATGHECVQRRTWNGAELKDAALDFSELQHGGNLTFSMGACP